MFNFSNASKPEKSRTRELVEENEKAHFTETRFGFLNEHRGLRPGMMHVILGTTGSGKTTLVRGVLADISRENKILIYSTEETLDQFQTQSGYASKVNLDNIAFIHETAVLRDSAGPEDLDGFIKQLKWAIEFENPKVVFIDNITTSVFYDQNKKAMHTAIKLRELMVEYKIPFFVIAHTASSVRDNMWFDSSQMRGFRTIANTAEYLYCLFRFRTVIAGRTQSATFLHVDKSRMHGGAKQIYRLTYDPAVRDYTKDEQEEYAKVIDYLKAKK